MSEIPVRLPKIFSNVVGADAVQNLVGDRRILVTNKLFHSSGGIPFRPTTSGRGTRLRVRHANGEVTYDDPDGKSDGCSQDGGECELLASGSQPLAQPGIVVEVDDPGRRAARPHISLRQLGPSWLSVTPCDSLVL